MTRRVTTEFFETIRLPVRRGRVFTADEVEGAEAVAVVSEQVAAALWPDADPLGRTLELVDTVPADGPARTQERRSPAFRVIGVVANAETRSPNPRDRHVVFFPFRSHESRSEPLVAVLVRASSAGLALQALRDSIARVHPEVALYARTLTEEIDGSVVGLRTMASALAALGPLGAIIALTGLYGVIAHLAEERRRDLIIMRALGATSGTLYRLISKESARMLLIGIVPGVLLALLSAFVLRRSFWALEPFDWQALIGVPLAMLAAGMMISVLPFRHVLRGRSSAELRGA